MCTVTFVPKSLNGFILTSNRDEAPGRETVPPTVYEEAGVELFYPKDAVAGGTWIGISEKKRVVCLMNGGFVAHKREPFYRKSRGLVVKDFLVASEILKEIESYNFEEIEPFTAVLIDWNFDLKLFQLVWDGTLHHLSEEALAPQIWSSSPLYPLELKKKREKWFSEFLFENLNPSESEILNFHKTAGEGDVNSNIIMDRGFIKTKSITQISRIDNKLEMKYEDLQKKVFSKSVFSVQ